jgi:hypothetical protein
VRRFLHRAIMISFVLISTSFFIWLLQIYDARLARQTLGFPDLWLDKVTMRTFDFYPYTGHHIQANYHQVGPDVWNDQDFDVKSGDHGFFVDFSIDDPPAKEPNEFRIVLIGGSAAQGWGGRTNDDMFYRGLEKRLNRRLAERSENRKIRIVNLAMGGAITYQNFVALNLWGHKLAPDLIISFSGINELNVYIYNSSNMYSSGYPYGGLALVERFAESPAWMKYLAQHYPGIFRYSALAQAMRAWYIASRTDKWKQDYVSRFPREATIPAAASFYAHALLSIQRDFPDVPLLLARLSHRTFE